MDDVDRCSQGHTLTCPVCQQKFTDINPDVAVALKSGHMRREHKES
jgi:hypothetical protein